MLELTESQSIFDEKLTPNLHTLGFEGRFPRYRRVVDRMVDLIDIYPSEVRVYIVIAKRALSRIKGDRLFEVSTAGMEGRIRLHASPEFHKEFPTRPEYFCFWSRPELEAVITDILRAVTTQGEDFWKQEEK